MTPRPPSAARATGRVDDRAQTFTLEAVVAAILLVASIAFALQVTGVTSQTSSTASEHVSNEHAALAAGALDAAAANGTLRQTVLYWNVTNGSYHDSNLLGYYETVDPRTAFLRSLNATFDERGLAVNVNVRFVDNGSVESLPIVRQGEPSDEAGRATVALTVSDDDRLYDADGTLSNVTVSEAHALYRRCGDPPDKPICIPDASSGPTYNVLIVEVIVWRV